MNIAIDFGNTSVKAGLFDGDKLIEQFTSLSNVELLKLANEDLSRSIIIGSVNDTSIHIINLFEDKSRLLLLNQYTPIPIHNKYQSPETLGVDRLAAAVGASFLFPKENCLVIDAGTCVKYDFIDKLKTYHGGSISPGIELRYKALNAFTSRLPLLSSKESPTDLIGNSTSMAIKTGVLHGIIGEVLYMIDSYKSVYKNLRILICGGDATFFETKIKEPIFAVPELVLLGLNRILNHNAKSI